MLLNPHINELFTLAQEFTKPTPLFALHGASFTTLNAIWPLVSMKQHGQDLLDDPSLSICNRATSGECAAWRGDTTQDFSHAWPDTTIHRNSQDLSASKLTSHL